MRTFQNEIRTRQILPRPAWHIGGPHPHHQLWQGAAVAVRNDISCWSQNCRAVLVLAAINSDPVTGLRSCGCCKRDRRFEMAFRPGASRRHR
jgi:hypothetical protein